MTGDPAAVLLDLDDTLIDGGSAREAIVATCAAIALARPSLAADRLLQANAASWEAYWPTIAEAWTLGTIDGATVRSEAWRRTLMACECDEPSLLELAIDRHVAELRAALRLYPDVHRLLRVLRDRRIPLGLITNGASDTQRDRLRALHLEAPFSVVVVSGEVGVAKPDIGVFRIALDKLGVRAGDAWHIGDNLQTDVAGARAAGIRAVWLNRDGATRRPDDPIPDLEVTSLDELADLLAP